jgi:type II secretory pathway pseudopilin PulG
MQHHNISGQSLFEVTVTLMIVSLVVTAIAGLAVLSIKSSSFSRNKTLATRYVQQANEWIRAEKDADWGLFLKNVGNHPDLCLQTLDWEGQPQFCLSNYFIEGTNLMRKVHFYGTSTVGSVEVDVSVSWTDNNGEHESNSVTYLTNH